MLSIILMIAGIIINLIRLWLELRNPQVAAEYKSRVDAVIARAKLMGGTRKDINELLDIREEIVKRFAKK